MAYFICRVTFDDLNQFVPLFNSYRQFYGQQSDRVLAKQFLRDRLSRNESVVFLAEEHARWRSNRLCAAESSLVVNPCRIDVSAQ